VTHLGGAVAVELQSSYCVQRTCSRSLHSNCLGQGSNHTLQVTVRALWPI